MAWIEGVQVGEMRLVPEHEPGILAATTTTSCPGANPENWTLNDILHHIRITLAGPEAEKLGPVQVSATEREFGKRELEQHIHQAAQYARQFGAGRIGEKDLPVILSVSMDDVGAVFQHVCVIRCVEALAKELLRYQTLSNIEPFIASRITDDERQSLRQECCLVAAKPDGQNEEICIPVTTDEKAGDELFVATAQLQEKSPSWSQ